jgi:hypothetical protein
MSCSDCEARQESPVSSFYRWKNADLEVRGCDAHLREVFEVLSAAQVPDVDKNAMGKLAWMAVRGKFEGSARTLWKNSIAALDIFFGIDPETGR